MTERSDSASTRRRLVIDLSACDRCASCGVVCAASNGAANGAGAMLALREKVTMELVCRRCRHASCIVACPFDALERREDGAIERHNLRCVSCKSCAVACPFGTIYAELLPFYSLSWASACRACLAAGDVPACVATCAQGALKWREVEPGEAGVRVIDEFLAARTRPWMRREEAA
jgi:Fe-S-cluster-containing hydrogenase component 2